jgi:hypothetical protein
VNAHIIELVIDTGGMGHCLYSEELDVGPMGEATIRRASYCEPDERGDWWADLSPVDGPRLGPFPKRSLALSAEVDWLRCNVLQVTNSKED